jgi:plastocyanin
VRRLGGVLVLTITLIVGCEPALAAPAAVPRNWVGMVTEDVFAGNDAYRDATLIDQRNVGVGLIRQTFHWEQIEPSRGVFDFSAYDPYVTQIAAHRMQLLPILFGEPAWASSRPATGAKPGTYPPRDPADFAAFAAAVARRYGPGGSFWAAHPTLPYMPVTTWQVWNEPNLRAYWPEGPDPAQYTALLRATWTALRGADHTALVVTAGLTQSTTTGAMSREDFLNGMYAAGAKGTFNRLGVNRYGKDDVLVPALESLRAILSAHGDSWGMLVSETGWATGGPAGTATVGEPGQAMNVKCTFLKLALRRVDLNVSGLIYDFWRDPVPYGTDFWGWHTGLLRLDGTRKPGYTAFSNAARELESPPAGNWAPRACIGATDLRPYTGDTVTFTSTSVDAEGPVAAQAWDLRNTGTFADGTATTASRSFPTAGTYLVSLRATDAAGATDVSSQEITVRNRPPVARFSVSPTSPVAGQPVTFTSTSTDPDGRVVSQAWDLDNDGSYDDGTATTATRTFTASGSYTVRLRAVDDLGASGSTGRTITVG